MRNPNWRKCILCENSKETLKRIPDNSVDFILTDPPYNLGLHSTGNIPLPGRTAMNNDVADWDKIDFKPEEWAEEFIRILKPTGNLFIFTSYNQLGRWYDCLDHRFDTSNFMVWHKTNPAPKIFKAGFLNSCEMIFTCWNKGHTWNFISQKEMHNFIESPICMRPERLSYPKHPTQKPISILKKMIEIASNENDIVFDPFMGVGSTGVAALELNRKFIGIEIDKTYFEAARKRIDIIINERYMAKYEIEEASQEASLHEPDITSCLYNHSQPGYYAPTTSRGANAIYSKQPHGTDRQSHLSPIIKWPGGKEKELQHIIPNLPSFKRYFEPFVGGGAVFMGINAETYFINDLSEELIELYKNISTSDHDFFRYIEAIDRTWIKAKEFFTQHPKLKEIYCDYRDQQTEQPEFKEAVHTFCKEYKAQINGIMDETIQKFPSILINEMERNLSRKMSRMRELEIQRHPLPSKDLDDNIETAIKSAVYMNFRHLYNNKEIAIANPKLHSALFFYMRNYAYSGMFRYSSKGDFNVPYGGIAYNSKLMAKKSDYYHSAELLHHFSTTHIYNLDFEEFLRKTKPSKDDFIFLDPPYDSEFSTYAQNAFTQDDQRRLANYLLTQCEAKWMMIIKDTDFIHSLYDKQGIYIRSFDKEYRVSFMNRNDRKATHLLITNY